MRHFALSCLLSTAEDEEEEEESAITNIDEVQLTTHDRYHCTFLSLPQVSSDEESAQGGDSSLVTPPSTPVERRPTSPVNRSRRKHAFQQDMGDIVSKATSQLANIRISSASGKESAHHCV